MTSVTVNNIFPAAAPRMTQSASNKTETSLNSSQTTGSTLPPTNPLLSSQQPAPMPQFILASGQLVQGIQGAQLLIPTSQGDIDKLNLLNELTKFYLKTSKLSIQKNAKIEKNQILMSISFHTGFSTNRYNLHIFYKG